jgi:hypothetical protein
MPMLTPKESSSPLANHIAISVDVWVAGQDRIIDFMEVLQALEQFRYAITEKYRHRVELRNMPE